MILNIYKQLTYFKKKDEINVFRLILINNDLFEKLVEKSDKFPLNI